MSYGKDQVPPSDDFERDEAIEAYRAVRTGAMALSALYLRNGNPAGALEAMESPRVARVVSPHLHEGLRRAAEENDPEAWLELFAEFDRLGTMDTDVALDPELSQAAAWGAAVGLFRAEPGTMRGAMPLATLLTRHRMAEVSPILLKPAVESTNRPEASSWALGHVLEALLTNDALGDVSAAQRTFREAEPLLDAVDKQPFAKDVSPSVARVRYAMGALEARSGELGAARPLVEAAVKTEPTLPGFELLAAIDRQRGNSAAALSSLDEVSKMATQASDPSAVSEAELTKYEVYRDQGDAGSAAKSLEAALYRALDARQLARTGPEHATAERALARVLDQYGSPDGARRAIARAYEASRSDPRQLTATVLEAARRGLTYGDLRAAREAVRKAIEANVAPEDLVYAALWLRLLERRLGTPTDGTVEEAFAKIDDDAGWAARLRAWGTGRLSDEQLLTAAKTHVEQTEASFYTAMAAYAANDARAGERLDRIAKSDSIELVEVAIARDLSPEKKHVEVKLPAQVEIP
jgi:tetratricopeptide (TPR) repeat protein